MIRNIIFTFILLIIINLLWTVISLESSPLVQLSNKILTCDTDEWALRGQIGDIMSGHFSALAFLAVALSIIFQYEANKQMRESIEKQETAIKLQSNSIEQQNKALKVQSKALEVQIEELKASREESEKQTEEFHANNINIKLDRLYKLLDIEVENALDRQEYINLSNVVTKKLKNEQVNTDDMESIYVSCILARSTYEILENIFTIIQTLEKSSKTYLLFYQEFSLKINVSHKISTLCNISNRNKYKFLEAFESKCFNLADLKHKKDL